MESQKKSNSNSYRYNTGPGSPEIIQKHLDKRVQEKHPGLFALIQIFNKNKQKSNSEILDRLLQRLKVQK